MESSRRKISGGAVGIFFILIIAAALFGLYHYYFKKNSSDQTDKGINYSSTETTDSNSAASTNSSNTSTSNFDYKGAAPTTDSSSNSSASSPSDPYSYYNLGVTALNNKNYSAAVDYFNQAIALKKDEPNFYNSKAEAQVSLKLKSDAINTLNEGLKYNPGNTVLQDKLDVIQNVVQ